MAELLGFGGSLKIATQAVASLNMWKVSIEAEEKSTKAFGLSWDTNKTGLKSWTAEASGNFVIATDAQGQAALQTAFLNGTDVALRLYVDGTNYYGGNAKVTKLDIDASVPELITISLSFKGNGSLSYN